LASCYGEAKIIAGGQSLLPMLAFAPIWSQFAFATYMAQVAEVEVSKDGGVRVRRIV
jgi:isoquinoline 1-oxidoreductase subunit beta